MPLSFSPHIEYCTGCKQYRSTPEHIVKKTCDSLLDRSRQSRVVWCAVLCNTAQHHVQVCVLVHEIQRVRAAPLSIQVYDEASSAAVREQCLSLCDVRAVLIEVVCRLDQLQNCQRMGIAKQQVLALQVCATSFPVFLLPDCPNEGS